MSQTVLVKTSDLHRDLGLNLPHYATEGSAGLDLHACIEHPVILKAQTRTLIPTGLFIALPQNYEFQIRPRSGLAFKNGITVLNTPGTIDSDYRGEIKIILLNTSHEDFTINPKDRIAQGVLAPVTRLEWHLIAKDDPLPESHRGTGGFGSTRI